MGFLDEFKRLAHPYEDEEEDNFEGDIFAPPPPLCKCHSRRFWGLSRRKKPPGRSQLLGGLCILG